MKSQRFRFRLISFALISILLITGIFGLISIPAVSSGTSLREAVLRLTNHAPPNETVPSVPAPAGAQEISSFHFESATQQTAGVIAPATDSQALTTPEPSPIQDAPAKDPASFNDALIQLFSNTQQPLSDESPFAAPVQ